MTLKHKDKEKIDIISTVDCKLKNVITDLNLYKSINEHNQNITEILWNMSIASNIVVTYLIENDKYIPPLDRTFYFSVIYSITSSSANRSFQTNTANMVKYIKEGITQYKSTNPPILCRDNCSDLLEVIIKDNFIINVKLNISENFYDIQRSFIYVNLYPTMNKILNNKLLFSLASHICNSINNFIQP
jgi:hypothetical protein